MKRHFQLAFVLTCWLAPLHSATLGRLSLDDMVSKSTMIVRGKVGNSWATASGPGLYTHYLIQVSETLKGPARTSTEVVVPGGTLNGVRQSFAGAPVLRQGDEFVFFLWTGSNGTNQVLGLTQGLFSLAADGSKDPVATRAASHEPMLDMKTGKAVNDETLVMPMSELRSRIATSLKGGAE